MLTFAFRWSSNCKTWNCPGRLRNLGRCRSRSNRERWLWSVNDNSWIGFWAGAFPDWGNVDQQSSISNLNPRRSRRWRSEPGPRRHRRHGAAWWRRSSCRHRHLSTTARGHCRSRRYVCAGLPREPQLTLCEVGLFALFTILGLVFYKFRGTPFGQRITQLFSSIGGAGSAALGGAAGATAAIVSRKEKESPQDQSQMGEKRPIPSPVVVAPAASANPFSDNHRLSANSPFSDAYRVTTPSPTPPSDAGHLSPTAAAAAAAAAATNKPLPTPPRFSSMTAGSSTSVGTTILSPSILSFPMPPLTPALTATATTMSPRTPAHAQAHSLTSPFISMDQPGKTVVRITRKPVPGRDSP